MRDTSARREKIISMLKANGSVQVADLAKMFHVSAVSLRKDLKFLADQEIATRTYGGAYLNNHLPVTNESSVKIKKQLNTGVKCNIAKAALNYIESGDSIILDSGTTTQEIAKQLQNIDELSVITNDFNIIQELSECDNVHVLALGGTLRRKSMSFYGPLAQQAMKNLHVNKLFLGVDGFHMERGLTTFFEPEASLNSVMCDSTSEIIVVTDSSKFDKTCMYKIIEPNRVTRVITDDGLDHEYKQRLTALGIDVVTVEKQE